MKKIYALVCHDLTPKSDSRILDHYSSKKKAVCALQEKADLYGVMCFKSEYTPSTAFCSLNGIEFFYCIREYDLL